MSNSISNITEYITFKKSVVDQFKKNMSLTDEMVIKLIFINSECSNENDPENNVDVSNYLADANNQSRLSLAFQQNPDLENSGFYDIGNMQP